MKRRGLVIGAAALAAGAAGIGAAWWRGRAGTDADDRLWTLSFATPGGAPLALASLRGRPLLLNFWATWCAPCVSELPLIDRFEREHRTAGWQVLGLAVDNPAPVDAFLKERPVGFAIALAGFEGVDLSRRLGNSTGALPFSVVFDRRGEVVQRKLGAIEPDDLRRWAAQVG